MQQGRLATLTSQEQLFLSLVEQLSRPLVQLNQLAEIGAKGKRSKASWQTAASVATNTLQLVESYALNLRVHGKLTPLHVEPVTVSSLLYDTAQQLEPFARQYNIDLQLNTGPRALPVLADRAVLKAAMASLGQVFILAQAEADVSGPVHLAAHRSRYGIVAGLYGNVPQLSADSLRRAHQLRGKAREPLHRLVSGPATGVFVADSLLSTLASHLHVARFQKLNGLATTLQPSHQMQFV